MSIKSFLIYLLFFFLICTNVVAKVVVVDNQAVKEMGQSIQILQERLDKEQPLLREIEWRSFYLLLDKSVSEIEQIAGTTKDKNWIAEPWRKASNQLLKVIDKTDALLQERLKRRKKSLLDVDELAKSEGTLRSFESERSFLENSFGETQGQLIQLQILKQRLLASDKSLAGFQRDKLNKTLTKTDEFAVWNLEVYQLAADEFALFVNQVKQSKVIPDNHLYIAPLFWIWVILWLWLLATQYRWNKVHAPLEQPSEYNYKRKLLVILNLLAVFIASVIIVSIIVYGYVGSQVWTSDFDIDINLRHLTESQDPRQWGEMWLLNLMIFSVFFSISLLTAKIIQHLFSVKSNVSESMPLQHITTPSFNFIVLSITCVQITKSMIESALLPIDEELGAHASFLLNVVALVTTSALLFLASRKKFWKIDGGSQFISDFLAIILQRTLLVIKLVAIFCLLLVILGRSGLAHYLIGNTLLTILFVLTFFIAKDFFKDFVYGLGRGQGILSSLEINSNSFNNVLHIFYGAGVIYIAFNIVVVTMMAWGVPEADINAYLNSLSKGFSIGNIEIAPYNILSAIVVLVSLIFVNGLLKQMLQTTLGKTHKISPSTKASIVTSFGYIGIIVALTTSIAVLGVNLTNVALIASGLSLGIGFGLQTIVSNFISGLIMLIERPVSIGDWVIVDGNEGIVRDIRFRATEIKTFEKAAVLVPNSSFISNVVTNITHQDHIRRISIPVSVAYDSDVELVKQALLESIDGTPHILRDPQASVYFMHFGSSSLDFELRFYTDDVLNSLEIESNTRFKINELFKREAIHMPYPQRVVHLESSAINPIPNE